MRLARFAIKNFKGIKEVEIRMPASDQTRPGSGDFLSIVGQNNAGKSSVLQAINLALSGDRALAEDQFYYHDHTKPVEVVLEFDSISESEKKLRAVNSHIFDGKYLVKKVWEKPGIKAKRLVQEPTYEYEPAPEPAKSKDDYLKNALWRSAIELYEDKTGTQFKPGAKAIEAVKRLSRESGLALARRTQAPSWAEDTSKEEDWKRDETYKSNPGGWASNLASAMPRAIYIPAIQETSEIADPAKQKSAIRQILLEIFNNRLNITNEMVRLRNAVADVARLFVSSDRGAIVPEMERQLSQEIQRLIDIEAKLTLLPATAKELCSDLIGRTELRLRDRWHKSAVGDAEFGPSTRPEHHGHGAQRALVLCLLQILAEQLYQHDLSHQSSLLLIVEEPEIYLHPEMCRRMRDTLLSIARNGRAQVICTTHSPIFLDLADRHDGIVIFRKRSINLEYVQKSDDIFDMQTEQKERLRMVLSFDPTVNEVFFTEKVCLVEGETEVAAIEAIATRIENETSLVKVPQSFREKYQQKRRKVSIINCRGKGTIPGFQHILNHFGINYRVIHDSDLPRVDYVPISSSEKAAVTVNNSIASALDASTRDICLRVHYPCFEQDILEYEPKSKEKAWQAVSKIKQVQISGKMIDFFEFALGESVEKLCSFDDNNEVAKAATENTKHNIPPNRNTRDSLKRIQVSQSARRHKISLQEAIGIAAGPGRIYDLSDDGYQKVEGVDGCFVAQVVGESMESTLHNGDSIVLKKIDTELPAVTQAENLDLSRFLEYIKHDGIYALALNQDIEDHAYTIKRVRIDTRSNGTWLCRIMADNPMSSWGDKGGSYVVRKTDRIHFAAQVVGLAFIPDREVLSEDIRTTSQTTVG